MNDLTHFNSEYVRNALKSAIQQFLVEKKPNLEALILSKLPIAEVTSLVQTELEKTLKNLKKDASKSLKHRVWLEQIGVDEDEDDEESVVEERLAFLRDCFDNYLSFKDKIEKARLEIQQYITQERMELSAFRQQFLKQKQYNMAELTLYEFDINSKIKEYEQELDSLSKEQHENADELYSRSGIKMDNYILLTQTKESWARMLSQEIIIDDRSKQRLEREIYACHRDLECRHKELMSITNDECYSIFLEVVEEDANDATLTSMVKHMKEHLKHIENIENLQQDIQNGQEYLKRFQKSLKNHLRMEKEYQTFINEASQRKIDLQNNLAALIPNTKQATQAFYGSILSIVAFAAVSILISSTILFYSSLILSIAISSLSVYLKSKERDVHTRRQKVQAEINLQDRMIKGHQQSYKRILGDSRKYERNEEDITKSIEQCEKRISIFNEELAVEKANADRSLALAKASKAEAPAYTVLEERLVLFRRAEAVDSDVSLEASTSTP